MSCAEGCSGQGDQVSLAGSTEDGNIDVGQEDDNNCDIQQDAIYDGRFNTSPLLGEFCGDTVPQAQISSGNQINLHFETDPLGSRHGFKLEYTPYSKYLTLFQLVECTEKNI